MTRIVTLLGTIALARLLTPEDFGVFAIVTFIVVLFTLVGDTGISGALIQQRDDPTDRQLATVLTFQLVAWTFVLAAIWGLASLAPFVVPELPPTAPDLARWIALGAWLNGLRSIPSVMLTRVLRFGPLALLEVAQQVVYFGLAVLLAASGHGVLSFGIAAAIQSVLGAVALWLVYGHWPGIEFDLSTLRAMWGFGLSFQLGYVLYWARDSVVAIFGSLAGGLQGVGFIQFAWRNGQFAVSVQEIIGRVAFPAFSRLQGEPDGARSVAQAAIEVGFLAIAVIQGWLAATAPSLIPIVFSDRWAPATPLFELVCVGSLAWGPVLTLRALVYATGDSRLGLRLAFFSVVAVFVLFPILAIAGGLVGVGIAFCAGASVTLLLYVSATREVVEFPWATIGRIAVEMAVSGLVAAVTIGIAPGALGLAASLVAYLVVFAVFVAIVERDLIRRSRAVFSGRGSARTPASAG